MLWARGRNPETLVPNKGPSSADIALNSLPRCSIIYPWRSKSITNSMQSRLTVGARWPVVQLLIKVTHSPMRWPFENSSARDAYEGCCELSFQANVKLNGPPSASHPCKSNGIGAAAPARTYG
jgi:hypothetical protein